MKNLLPLMLIIFGLFSCERIVDSRLGFESQDDDPKSTKNSGLELQEPDSIPRLFAPGIISNGLNNRDITMSPNGKEIYTTSTTSNYSFATILVSEKVNNMWTVPQVVSFGKDPYSISIEPCLSSDGNTLFYASNKPPYDSLITDDMNIWKVERIKGGWGEPMMLDSNINTSGGEYYPSVTNNGTLYFTREEANRINFIYRSRLIDNKYSTPQKLPKQVNCGHNRFNAYISPDESFIIIPAMGVEASVQGANYYISFRSNDDSWSEPLNLGSHINKDLGRGWSASLSYDGKFLFFMSSRGMNDDAIPSELTSDFFDELQTKPQNGNSDIYWVSSNFIEDLRNKVVTAK